MTITDEERTKWIENRFNELSSSRDYSISAEEIMDLAEEEFYFMLDEASDMEFEEHLDKKHED